MCGHAWIETYAVITRLPGASRRGRGRRRPPDGLELLHPLSPQGRSCWPRLSIVFAAAGIAGGATYDGWVALCALDNRTLLASRDARAETTYRRLGVDLEMLT